MSKNLTRKGLALGAVVALGSSLFAGTPATAAPTALYLQSAFGTSTTGVLGQYFIFAGSTLGGASPDVVKYYVEGATAANLTYTGRFTTDLTAAGSYAAPAATAATVVDNDAKTAVIASPALTAGNFWQFGIKLNSTNVTATTSLKVTPFLDSVIADGKPGANELTGTAMTVNFVKGSELTATPTITAPLGAAATATVAVSGGVNVEQFRANANGGLDETPFKVLFQQTGVDWGSDRDALWDTTDKVLAATSASTTTALTYGAKGRVVVSSSSTVDSASASAVTATAGEVSDLGTITVANGSSYRAARIDSNFPYSTTNVIRAGSGSLSVSTAVTAVSGKSAAGQKVTFTITEASVNSLPNGATIAVTGGSTLTAASSTATESITREVVSGADGKAVMELTYAGITDGKTFNISAKAVGSSAPVTEAAVTYTAQDSYAVAFSDTVKDSNASAVRRIAKLGAINIPLKVVDQFGQTPTGTFRVVVSNSGATDAPSITSPVAVTSGNATIAGTDNSTTVDDYTVSATLQKLGADGVTYAAIGRAVTLASTIDVGTVAVANAISITPTGSTSSVTRAGKALVAGNSNADQDSKDFVLGSNSTSLNSAVTSTTGANVAGVAVTYSATGVLFVSGTTRGLGSLTVYTGADGTTGAVSLYSNNTGKQTITVTSGSATKTQVVTWAAVTAGGSAWTVTAPASILPGQTLKVSAVLKDKYGATVDTTGSLVKVSYTGPGFVTATLPTDTDEDGAISFTVLLGSGDSGTATVKLTYANTNGFDEVTLNDDVVSTTSIVIGAAPVVAPAATAAVSGSTGKFFVSATNAAAKRVVVKVAGKFFSSFAGTAAKKSVALKAPKGKHKVTVFVGGKLVATKTITVK